ncbi:MAG: hypothetical protein MJ014_00100 [Methanocorpusculum sp.]|nr:hypothetical protein [Methanocorpusculum sp.]
MTGGVIEFTVSLDGHILPYSPSDLVINDVDRSSQEFISIGENRRVVEGGGGSGLSPVRRTVTFTIYQYPKIPASVQYGGERMFDFIEMLRTAKENQRPVRLEMTLALPQAASDANTDGNTAVIDKKIMNCLVESVSQNMTPPSGFYKTAQVILREYHEPLDVLGELRGNMSATNQVYATFTTSGTSSDAEKAQQCTTYVDTCALEWIYSLYGDNDPDSPGNIYPPSLMRSTDYYLAAYPMGTESHVGAGEHTAAPELEATPEPEKWSTKAVNFLKGLRNNVAWGLGKVAEGVETVLGGVERAASAAFNTLMPYVSTIATGALSFAVGGWPGLAMFALRDFPWAGHRIANAVNDYRRTQNVLTTLGNQIKYSIAPDWQMSPMEWGLGYDAKHHRTFFRTEDISLMQAKFKNGQKIFDRTPEKGG